MASVGCLDFSLWILLIMVCRAMLVFEFGRNAYWVGEIRLFLSR